MTRVTLLSLALLLGPALARGANLSAAHVAIRDHTFVPAVVYVKPGQAIVWQNMDQDPHTVTSGGHNLDDGHWTSSPLIPDGQTFTLRLQQPGRYPYYCKPHQYEASMHGTIVVEP